MTTLNQFDILQEIVVGLRNADIFTTTQRNVVTTTTTGTVAGTSVTINKADVKNIRSITIGSTALAFGTEYTADYDYSGTCVLTFAGTQTGTYSAVYDYGTDKIFSGYPRNDISINSFPRIAVDFIDISSEAGGFGNVNLNRWDVTVVAYDTKKEEVRGYVQAIRNWIVLNQNRLYYSKLIKPTLIGPIGIGEFEKFKDRIFQQNVDFRSILQYEIN